MDSDTFTTLPCELEDSPGKVKCPHCDKVVTTVLTHVTGRMTWIVCAALTLTCIPCCCIPFICNSTKDIDHTCPECKKAIFRYKIV
ncbi:LITAF/PIG7 possible membrane associated motif in LPS-induced tumor necrosis factor alpha factor [Largemouth bass virus]|nr:putative LITAF PIG7 possible membrane associated motif in LPS-induced tumor necrosis factor alpha factor [Mandarin fish ranavirus]WEI28982.1 LITAF/PIG7 possible membrane associated motif in LPS-induced tumor necrosis factor alpha factor [Largemouth bass virus]WHA35549.1 hypothetical protein MSRaV_61L [Micropterus salmoides ranavirus]WHA35654.1 hypothetical protein SCRaV_61L [Siniperca chuatsi ranavirus]